MTTNDEARVTDEEIARQTAWARERIGKYPEPPHACVIVALADRLAARDAEVARLRAERDMFENHAHEGWALANHRTRQWRAADGERDALRAEREEMVALLERFDSNTASRYEAGDLLAKLRGAPADPAPPAPEVVPDSDEWPTPGGEYPWHCPDLETLLAVRHTALVCMQFGGPGRTASESAELAAIRALLDVYEARRLGQDPPAAVAGPKDVWDSVERNAADVAKWPEWKKRGTGLLDGAGPNEQAGQAPPGFRERIAAVLDGYANGDWNANQHMVIRCIENDILRALEPLPVEPPENLVPCPNCSGPKGAFIFSCGRCGDRGKVPAEQPAHDENCATRTGTSRNCDCRERPAPTCRCGSGMHPRRCEVHPARYAEHCAEISAESEAAEPPAPSIPLERRCGECGWDTAECEHGPPREYPDVLPTDKAEPPAPTCSYCGPRESCAHCEPHDIDGTGIEQINRWKDKLAAAERERDAFRQAVIDAGKAKDTAERERDHWKRARETAMEDAEYFRRERDEAVAKAVADERSRCRIIHDGPGTHGERSAAIRDGKPVP